MYRIRLPSGEQSVFRTLEELTLAVQSGVVGPSAEVYLPEANRWMSVEAHPDYQSARLQPLPEQEPLHRPLTPTPLPLAEIPGAAPLVARPPPVPVPSNGTVSQPTLSEPAPESQPAATPQLPPSVFVTRARKLREMLALKFGLFIVIGASVLLTVYLAGSRSRWFGTVTAEAHEGMTPPEATATAVQPASDAAPEPAPPDLSWSPDSAATELAHASDIAERPAPTRESLAAAPNLDPYKAGYEDARGELDDALAYVRFTRVFAPVRMRSADSLRATRRAIAAAGNIVRTYRAREVMLEQTVGAMLPPALSKRESFEAGVAARGLLEDTDSLYALLTSQYGRYSVGPDTILFANPTAATVWNRVRGRLLGTLSIWRDSVSTSAGVTLPRLARSLGSPAPPLARQ